MSRTECRYFENKLAFHTAPSLLGIKCANLVSFCGNEFNIEEQTRVFNSKAVKKGLKISILCRCKERVLILLYSEKLLTAQLNNSENKAILKKYGYDDKFNFDDYINRLSERISENHEFPHEIGIFLGYPIEDVTGFIENKGENFKLCGCWKVYGDEEKAKRIFDNYNKCRKFLCNKLNQGDDIYQALKIS